MEFKINFIRAALGETITADARLIHLGRPMAMGEAEITDERGKLVAKCLASLMMLPADRPSEAPERPAPQARAQKRPGRGRLQ